MSESISSGHVCTLEIRPVADGEHSYPDEAIQASYIADFGLFPHINRWRHISISKEGHGVLRLNGCLEIIDVATDYN